MSIVYIDELSIFSLMSLIFSRTNYEAVFYFNTTQFADKLSSLLTKVGILYAKPKLAEFFLADIKDEKGTLKVFTICTDLREICFEIADKEFTNSDFLRNFGQYFDFKKLLLFFRKSLSHMMYDTFIYLNVAKWHAKNKVNIPVSSTVFFLEKSFWSHYLLKYTLKLNVRLVEYQTLNSRYSKYAAKGLLRILLKIKSKLKIVSIKRKTNIDKKQELSAHITDKKKPLVASRYAKRTVTFDSKKRSDFFWLLMSDIPHEQVVIYFYNSIVTKEMKDVLKREGIGCLALSANSSISKNISDWNPCNDYKEIKKQFVKLIFRRFLLSTITLKSIPLFFLIQMLYFVEQYSYWYCFYKDNNIKVDISWYPDPLMTVPMNLALEKNDGVSIYVQSSNLQVAHAQLSISPSVLFSFGPAYKWVWEANRSEADNLLYYGYMTDYSFKEVREDSLSIRRMFNGKGVSFIICYFDEGSSDDRMSALSHGKSAMIYEFLLKKVLEDKTLGIIFKPKKPKDLYRKISSIKSLESLIEIVQKSGRCVLMDKGAYVTDHYPAEASQAADLCIGLLAAGTSALESFLSGTPTLFLDLEGFYLDSVYQWGRGKVVFDNLDDMFTAIQKFREDPLSMPGFGDLSSWVADKDPFKDGNASLRIGQYVNWLLQVFNQGRSREDAIKYANQMYAERWGKENVIRLKE